MDDRAIVITGACGFIGSNMLHALSKEHKVVAVDHFDNINSIKNIFGSNVYDFLYPDELINKSKNWMQDNVKAIIHLGANSSTTSTDVPNVMQNNVMTTIRLATKFAPETRFVYASSASVYGIAGGYFSEDRDIKSAPLCLYAQSKLWVDLALMGQENVFGLRFFNVYGPREGHKGGQASVILSFRKQILSKKHVVELFCTNEKNAHKWYATRYSRDWVYVDDVVEITRRIALGDGFTHNCNLNHIYNVGTGDSCEYESIVKNIGDRYGIKPKIKYIRISNELHKQYQEYTCADNKKLLASLNGYSFVGLKEGINKYLNQPESEI